MIASLTVLIILFFFWSNSAQVCVSQWALDFKGGGSNELLRV